MYHKLINRKPKRSFRCLTADKTGEFMVVSYMIRFVKSCQYTLMEIYLNEFEKGPVKLIRSHYYQEKASASDGSFGTFDMKSNYLVQ